MFVYYAIPAGIVFLVVLGAFLADPTTPKTHLQSWIFVLVASLLWPVTLPFIVWNKVLKPLTQAPKPEPITKDMPKNSDSATDFGTAP